MFFHIRSQQRSFDSRLPLTSPRSRGRHPVSRGALRYRAFLMLTGAVGLIPFSSFAQSLIYSFERRVTVADPFSLIYSAGISEAGTVAFLAQLSAGGQAIYTAAPGGAAVQLANTSGPLDSFSFSGEINTAGTVAFAATLDNGTRGIYTAAVGGAPIEVARTGVNGFTFLSRPSLNASGTVAFPGETSGQRGLYTAASGAAPVRKADDSGPINLFGADSPITSAGKIAFLAVRDAGNEAIYTLAPGGSPVELVNTSGPTSSLYNHGVPSLSDAGYVAFAAGRDAGGDGIYLSVSGGAPLEVVNTNGIFSEFLGTDVNAVGLLAFTAILDGGNTTAVYYRQLGQTPVRLIGPGDLLDGSMVTGISPGGSILNDAGQIAFVATLVDGRSGIYVASAVPEPSGLVAIGALTLVAIRTRCRIAPAL